MSEENKAICMTGKKVNLRAIHNQEDLPSMWRWINDGEVVQYIGSTILPTHYNVEKEFAEKIGQSKEDIVFAIDDKVTGEFIGLMGLHKIDWISRHATTGAMIGNKDYWGKEYGTDAKMLLLNYAFTWLNLRRINSEVVAFNKRSYRYLLRCGYKLEGEQKQFLFRNGRYWNKIHLGLFKKDFMPLWREYKKDLPE